MLSRCPGEVDVFPQNSHEHGSLFEINSPGIVFDSPRHLPKAIPGKFHALESEDFRLS